jgi:alpha-L-rhamnosidase
MSECWSWGRYDESGTVTEMTSAAHVYGRNIIGQETFTANSEEKWLGHPAVVKEIGDWTFCEGINRFVFHRYAMQPWTTPHSAPGMSMGPWGLHYERTQTWWNMSKPWHDYVARCCYMLRQGNFVADVCYMQAEGAPSRFSPPNEPSSPEAPIYPFPAKGKTGQPLSRPGYNYDGCPPEVVLERMEFVNGFFTLPGGMKYRVLVLPESHTMTPQLLRKIKTFVDAGALVIGPKPGKSPSLCNYPLCDDEVQKLSAELWDNGKIISGTTAAEALARQSIAPDFDCDQPMVRWIHRRTEDMDIYFVANGAAAGQYPYAGNPMVANCSFRIRNIQPEIWDPETGRTSPVVVFDTSDDVTRVPLVLPAKASVFIVFRRGQKISRLPETISSIGRNGKTLLAAGGRQTQPQIEIISATYGKPGDAQHMRDAKADVQKLVDDGEISFPVARIAAIGGDPDLNVVKTLEIFYRIDGKEQHLVLDDKQAVDLSIHEEMPPATVEATPDGTLQLCVTKSGEYQASNGANIVIPDVPEPLAISEPWTVTFPDGWGAPSKIQLEVLASLHQHSDDGVRHFSGTATYHCTFDVPTELLAADRRFKLDLGDVAVMADVTLNGQRLGILWKSPFTLDVTSALQAGQNTLDIAVANLWVNRLIGDQQLPPDADRNGNGTLKSWPQWLLDGKPSPTGRFAFTTHELWHKDNAPVDSGLIGPVQLRTIVCRPLKS